MNKHFLGYGRQSINDSDIRAVVRTLKGDYLTQGPAVDEFEKAITTYTGARYCVAVANGTAALHLAVAALRLEEGGEGITSPNSFVASANCLVYNRLIPRFADIDESTYNIDPGEVRKRLTKKTKVLIPVHFAGQPADMPTIHRLAQENGCAIIEDAAHAIGSRYADGGRVGNSRYSDLTVFSFHPVKTITTAEGGAITTNNRELFDRLLQLRSHGITRDPVRLHEQPGPWYYEMQTLGFNYRLTDLQAALGSSQMRRLDSFVHQRREIVARYNHAFASVEWLRPPVEEPSIFSAFHLYVLRIDFGKIGKTRAVFMKELKIENIGTQVHYIPIHTQPYYRETYGYRWGDFPKAEKYYHEVLSIPLFPAMSKRDTDRVINAVLRTGGSI